MVYALVKDGEIIREHNFGDEAPPTLAPVKGRWVEIIRENQPIVDYTKNLTATVTITDTAVTYGWSVTDKNAQELAIYQRNQTLSEIAALEKTITPRRLREAITTTEGAEWLAALDAEIAALRATL